MADRPVAFFSVRKAVWSVTVCGLVVATGIAAGPVRMKLAGNPVPSAGQVQAAQNQVNKRAAALGKQEEQVAQANAKLTDLQNQAEILTQNYDKAMVDEQQAQSAYTTAVNKLAAAKRTQQSSQREVGALAANEYETEGGFDPMAAMLGDAHGMQAYLNQMGLGQVFTNNRTDILAKNNADSVVAGVFRSEASTALKQKKSAAQQAAQLKTQVQAAVAAQLDAVKQSQSVAGQLSGGLQSAKNHENHVANQRAQALAAAAAAAAAAAERARASRAANSAANSAPSAPSSFTGSAAGSSQGDIAADFALSQIGKPYQWGAAGPSTYDCSGLAMVAWAQAGVSILHYTGDQWNEGAHVPLSDMQRGDLIFYATNNSDPATIHHVGIYIGDGEMVDAPYTGVDVRIDSIYQPGQPIGAVRP
ncbi:MAG TPA: NlpC/P60 family protein [Streptosporangiaceae bacterium]|jgi:cell wall-associated NlpC family hydrolase|nr:NlpC/P60 family protein [Streptosporangiaceae bacterium]